MKKTTAIVTVLTPCTCGADRWFRCVCAEVVAEYECAPFDGIDGVPTPEHVAQVERMHPGLTLRYIHLGPTYETQLKSARAALASRFH